VHIDPATVYRILDAFYKTGIVQRFDFRRENSDMNICKGRSPSSHLSSCGRIEDISDCAISALQKDIQKKKGISVKSHTLEFYGICKLVKKKELRVKN